MKSTNDKMKQFVASKMVKKVSTDLKCPLKDALCILVLDDFYDDVYEYSP